MLGMGEGNMKKAQALVLAASPAGLSVASAARADPINVFNTGVDNSHNVLSAGSTDPHYTLVSSPSGPGAAFVVDAGSPIAPTGPWVANDSVSQWMAPTANQSPPISDPLGQYDYRLTFDLAGLNSSTAILQGQWATDNNAVLDINGTATGNFTGIGAFGALSPFSITSGFISGINTLDFIVTQISCGGCNDNPTGLRVEFTNASAAPISPVPEPASILLLGGNLLGLALITAATRRRGRGRPSAS